MARNKYERNKTKSNLSIDLSPSNISYSFLPSYFRYYYKRNNTNKYSEKHIFHKSDEVVLATKPRVFFPTCELDDWASQ
jgi:hypothetical protein